MDQKEFKERMSVKEFLLTLVLLRLDLWDTSLAQLLALAGREKQIKRYVRMQNIFVSIVIESLKNADIDDFF